MSCKINLDNPDKKILPEVSNIPIFVPYVAIRISDDARCVIMRTVPRYHLKEPSAGCGFIMFGPCGNMSAVSERDVKHSFQLIRMLAPQESIEIFGVVPILSE